MESPLSIFRESYLSRYSIFTPGLAMAFLSVLFVKHFPTQSHEKAATSQWAACNVTIFFALQEGIEMKKLIALKFPYTARFALNVSNKKATETLRGQIWLRCSHVNWRSTEEGLDALLLMDAFPPDISTFLLGAAKVPLHLETFVLLVLAWCYHFSSREALHELRLTQYPQTYR